MLNKKICLLGDFAVGKTSLIRRFVYDKFDDSYLSTIGVKISRKALNLDLAGKPPALNMLIWDLAGGEEFSSAMLNYYRGAAGAIIVCDLTRKPTLDKMEEYAKTFLEINRAAPLVFVGNKVDLENERVVSDADLAAIAQPHDAPLYTSSAKTGENVEELFMRLGKLLVKRDT